MKYRDLLIDAIDNEKAEKIQKKYANLIKQQESQIKIVDLTDFDEIKQVVGLDISYCRRGNVEFGIACAVLWDLKECQLIDEKYVKGVVNFPYTAGFLGFRESILLIKALNKLKEDDLKPDVVMCDGHGIIHPRRFGEAVHIGLTSNLPTFGVAKNPYIGYLDLDSLGTNRRDKVPIVPDQIDLQKISTAEILGYAIRLNDNAKPVYVSKGYRISIDLAIKIALETTLDHRQPEPLYLADKLSRKKIKELE